MMSWLRERGTRPASGVMRKWSPISPTGADAQGIRSKPPQVGSVASRGSSVALVPPGVEEAGWERLQATAANARARALAQPTEARDGRCIAVTPARRSHHLGSMETSARPGARGPRIRRRCMPLSCASSADHYRPPWTFRPLVPHRRGVYDEDGCARARMPPPSRIKSATPPKDTPALDLFPHIARSASKSLLALTRRWNDALNT